MMFKWHLLLLLKGLANISIRDSEADEVNHFMYLLKLTFTRINKFHITLIRISVAN